MQYDLFAADPTLRFKEKPKVGSVFLGIVSLIILGLFSYLLFIRVNATIKMDKNEIKYSIYKQIESTSSNVNNFMFAIKPYLISKNLSFYQEHFLYTYQYWNEQKKKIEILEMEVCQPDQWSLLGQNYRQIFYDKMLNESFCPSSLLQISEKLFNENLFNVYIKPCNKSNPNRLCKKIKNSSQLNYEMDIELNFLSKKIIINNPNPISYYIKSIVTIFNIDLSVQDLSEEDLSEKYYLDFYYKKKVSLAIDKYRIQHTPTFLSVFKENYLEKSEDYTIGNHYIGIDARNSFLNDSYVQINFLIKEEIQVYSRQRSTIDQIISDIGGLYQIFMIFLLFFLKSYDKIRYQLTVAGSFFNYNQDGKKFQRNDLNLWTYFKHGIFHWIKLLFCFQIKQTQTIILNQTLEEAREILDVKNLYRRIEFMEKVVDSSFDKNLLQSIAVVRQNTIQEFRAQRLLLSYYQNVIKLQEAATVEDAIAARSESFTYLSRKTILQHIESLGSLKGKKEIVSSSQELRLSLMNDLELNEQTSKCISYYPMIAQKAKFIKLDVQDEEMEFQITKAFLKLDTNEKHQVIKKMPILILHRIRMVAMYLNTLERRNSLFSNQISVKKSNLSQKPLSKQKYEKPLKQRIIKRIKSLFCFFDLFEAEPILRVEHKASKSNPFFGFINAIIIGLLIFYLIQEIKQLIEFNSSKLTINTYQELQTGQKQIKNFMMALKFPKSKKGYFKKNHLKLYEQFVYKLRDRDRTTGNNKELNNTLVPCKAENWKLLGENFTDYFLRQNLNESYCIQVPLNITALKGQTSIYIFYIDFQFKCLQQSNYNCSSDLNHYYFQMIEQYKNFPFWLYYLVPEVEANKQNPIVYHIKGSRFGVPKKKSGFFTQTYTGYKVSTDKSIWPYLKDIDNVTHYGPESVAITSYSSMASWNTVTLMISDNILVYDRKRKKITDIFSYFGGLLGFIFVFFEFFFTQFNEIRYELKVGESSFNYDAGGKKFSQKKFNFFFYIQYKIFNLIKIFCKNLKWKKMQELEKTLEETTKLLDTENLILRLQFIDKVIQHSTDKNILISMTLLEDQSIKEVRKKRNLLNYYGKVIQDDNVATVEDAVKKIQKSFTYLSDLIEAEKNKKQFLTDKEKEIQEKKQQAFKSQIYSTLIQYLKIEPSVSKAISQYPIIAEQARNIELDHESNQMESEITLSFIYLEQRKKHNSLCKSQSSQSTDFE